MTEEQNRGSVHSNAQEEAFFARSPDDADAAHWEDEPLWENDEDVIIPPAWKPMIPLFLVFASALVLSFLYDDFQFALSPRTPVQLGSVLNGCNPALYKKLPHNRLVRLRGVIPQPNLTAEARVHFSKRYYVVVLGCDLLVSLEEPRYRKLVGPRSTAPPARELPIPQNIRKKLGIKAKIMVTTPDALSDTNFAIVGRAMRASRSTSTDNLRRFYAVTESVSFTPHTYLIFDGEHPNNMWWVLLVYGALGLFILYNLFRFFREVRRHWF